VSVYRPDVNAEEGPLFTVTDLAVALVDEAVDPRHHRDLVGVAH
jgi:putative NADH-flavin reductase